MPVRAGPFSVGASTRTEFVHLVLDETNPESVIKASLMPPRKDPSNPAPSLSQTQQDAGSEGIEDVELPKLLVTQLAQSGVHPGFRLEDETITALVKSATVFINHLTSAAHEVATSRAHKTISAADVSKALENVSFPSLETCAEQFQNELEIFRQGMKHEKHDKHEKGKNKPPESKGKTKEKDTSSRATISSSLPQSNHVDGVIVPETGEGTSVDVDMHEGDH